MPVDKLTLGLPKQNIVLVCLHQYACVNDSDAAHLTRQGIEGKAYLKRLVRRARELYRHIKDRETGDESGSTYVTVTS